MHVPRYVERLTPVKEAITAITSVVSPVTEVVEVATWDAIGMVLAEDVKVGYDFPPRPRAAYDGYAVRSDDTPGRLKLVGEATIGIVDVDVRVEQGTAVYVSTGAYLPEGADTVVPEEAVRIEGDYIVVDRKFTRGKNIDPVGSYIAKGSVLLRKGHVVTELDAVGLLDVGVTSVKVYRKLRVGIIATGTELFEPYMSPKASKRILGGEVAETTAKLVSNLITRFSPWASIAWKILLPDNTETIAWYLTRQTDTTDLVVLTGGSGPSNVDPFYQLAQRLKARVLFRGLFVKGGRPTSAMLLEDRLPVIVLSGHPISALHGYVRLLYHVLKYMGNVERGSTPPLNAYARLAAPIKSKRPQPVKVKLRVSPEGYLEAYPLPPQRQMSSVTVSNVEADGIAVLEEARVYDEGEWVPVYMYREPLPASTTKT
ncbi:MAG: molybdopterin molybdenumtransferase MoeA [Hyperthermus sp.]|nr:MAG: molybdopterin molybdenumtransferase MoeA [Hyperthermus sp.]